MDDAGPQEEASGFDFPFGSIHAAEHHVSARKARVYAVLYIFHLAEHEKRTHGLLHRTHSNRSRRLLPPQSLAEHTRHSSRIPAARRPSGVYGEARAGS